MKGYDSICCFRSGEGSLTKRVCWEITTDCNLDCPFCHRSGFEPDRYDMSRLPETAALLKENGIRSVILSGGEPMLHPDFFGMVDFLQDSGFDVDVCTNGTLLGEAAVRRLKERLGEISVSIDGYEAARHDAMRRAPGSFETVTEAVQRLVRAGIAVHTTTVVDPPFASGICRTAGFLHGLGVRSASFLGLIPVGRGANGLFEPEVQELLESQVASARSAYPDMEINTKQLLASRSGGSCGAGRIVFGMGVDGAKLHPCLLLRPRGKKTGESASAGLCPGSRYLTRPEEGTP